MKWMYLFFLIVSIQFSIMYPLKLFSESSNRYALVIGNGTYAECGRLKNPVNDARDIAATLSSLGFTVEIIKDASLGEMEDAVVRLGDHLRASPKAYGFFYYAGHGIQSDGINYLIPVDADIKSESFLKTKALPAQSVLDTLQRARNSLNIVVLDACRDNPFNWARGGARGLSVVSNQPPGSIIVYATSAGVTSQDGEGRNGLFTSKLLENLGTPGLEINEIFRRTGKEVQSASGNRQIPAIYSQCFENVCLKAGVTPATIQPVVSNQETPFPGSGTLEYIEGGSFKSTKSNYYGKSGEVSSFWIGKYEVTQKEWREVMGGNPSEFVRDDFPVECVSWYDCIEYCNKRSEREGLKPVYRIDKHHQDPNNTNTRKLDGLKWIIDVDWLANGYRLPTEAEWEYAASGGKESMSYEYAGSNTAGQAGWFYENAGDTQLDDDSWDASKLYPNHNRTHFVGNKQANELGLYDMSGNVYEWCWDWYDIGLVSNQINGRGPETGSTRVIRGGSWGSYARRCQVGYRNSLTPDSRNSTFGFRVVKSAQ